MFDYQDHCDAIDAVSWILDFADVSLKQFGDYDAPLPSEAIYGLREILREASNTLCEIATDLHRERGGHLQPDKTRTFKKSP